MTKGIVMEIRKKDCVVLTETGAFVRVRSRGGTISVGDEITVPEVKRSLPRRSWMMGSVAAAAAFMLVVVFSVLPGAFPHDPTQTVISNNEAVAYISIDINPSIELGIDGEKRVVDVKELNEDGAELLGGLSLLGEEVDSAVRSIMEEAESKVLKDRDSADIVITSVVVAEDADLQEGSLTAGLQEEVRQVLAQHHKEQLEAFRVTVWSAPTEVREEAEAQGLSTGKMAFYLKAKSDGADVSVEELKTNSIHDVAEKFKEKDLLSSDDSYTKDEMKQLLKQQKEEMKKAKKNENRPAGMKNDDDGENSGTDDQDDDKDKNVKNNGNNGKNNGNKGKGKGGGDDDKNGGPPNEQTDRDKDRDRGNGNKGNNGKGNGKQNGKEKDKGQSGEAGDDKGTGSGNGNGNKNGDEQEDRKGNGNEDQSNNDKQGRTGTSDDGLKPGKGKNAEKTPPGQAGKEKRSVGANNSESGNAGNGNGKDKGNIGGKGNGTEKSGGNGNGRGNSDKSKGSDKKNN